MPIRPLGPVGNARPSSGRVRSEGAADRRSLDSSRDKYKKEMQIVRMTGRKSVEAFWENVIGELSGPDPELVKSYMRPTISSVVKRNARIELEGIPECDHESNYLDDEMHAFIEQWLEDACPSECAPDTMSDGVMAAVPTPRFSEAESIPTDEFQKLVRGASTEFLALVDTLNNPQDPEMFSFALHETEQRVWPRRAIGKETLKMEGVQTEMGGGAVQTEGAKSCNPWGKVVSFAAGAGTALGLVLLKN